jgi:iron(III) transport system permease protein
MARDGLSEIQSSPTRLDGQVLALGIALGLMLLLVLLPTAVTLLNSFRTIVGGRYSEFNLRGWQAAFSDPGMRTSVLNTATLLLLRTVISFPVAILIAWLLARTDLPGRSWLEFMFWVSFFLPSLAVTLGWILLLDSQSGLLNQLMSRLFRLKRGLVDIYSYWGIVWTHLASSALSFKIVLLTPLFRQMDSTFEEASRVSGATWWQTFLRILLPAMIPAVTLVLVAAVLFGLQTFEIEMILGSPIRLFVYSTTIYSLLRQEPPLIEQASALSAAMLVVTLAAAAWQRWLTGRSHYEMMTGRFIARPTTLRGWKVPALLLVWTVSLVLTIVPFSMLIVSSLMTVLGYFQINHPWTLDHWRHAFSDQVFVHSSLNTVKIGFGTSVVSVVCCTLVAYLAVRTRYRARIALDLISWLPIGLPGILLGVGLIAVFSGVPAFRPLYGTTTLLIVAGVIGTLAMGTQLIKTNMLQIGSELEEASRVAGASAMMTFRRVVVPVLKPVLLLVAVTSFTRATQDVSSMVLLATASSRPLSLLQIDYMTSGDHESAAVVATLIASMSVVGALLAWVALNRMNRQLEMDHAA